MNWLADHLILATLLLVIVAIVATLLILRGLHHIYPHEPTRAQVAGVLVSLTVTVLCSVFLTNLFAMRRDKVAHLRTLRDGHLERLRTVLGIEAIKLREIGALMEKERRVSELGAPEETRRSKLSGLLWPEEMSSDLTNHFSNYESAKRNLQRDIEQYDSEFLSLQDLIASDIDFPEEWRNWKENVATAKVAECIGYGNGMSLTVNGRGGYSYSLLGGGGATSAGEPPRELVAASNEYKRIKLDAAAMSKCGDIRQRARAIVQEAAEISKRALVLSQVLELPGDCEFTAVRR